MNNGMRKMEIRRASAMPCKATKLANPNGWYKIEAKRQNSSCSEQDHENKIIIAKKPNYNEKGKYSPGAHRRPKSRFHMALQRGAETHSHTDSNEFFLRQRLLSTASRK